MSVLVVLLSSLAFHTYGGGGILSGFLHPLLGLGHLLAMLAVGFISAQVGGRAVWTVPTAFVVAMVVGAIMGMAGVLFPASLVEYGITGSVLLLGVGILVNRGVPEWGLLILVGMFGFFHGHAHGTELPALSDTIVLIAAYVAGFIVATVGLHVIGALIAMIVERQKNGLFIMRAVGGVIAVVGIFLVIGV